jgi:putative transposase
VLCEHDVPIAPGTYYAHRSRPVSDAGFHDAQMANSLLEPGRAHDVGRDQVARLMGILGIRGVWRGAPPHGHHAL